MVPPNITFRNSIILVKIKYLLFGDTESVMYDVIKIRLKRRDERRIGKGNP